MANERFLSIAQELTFGTLPTAGWRRIIALTSSTLALNKDTYQSNAIIGNRGLTAVRPGNDNPTGGLPFELVVAGLEPFWYNALGSAYSDGANPSDTGGTTRTASAASEGDTNILVDATAAAALSPGDLVRIGTIASFDTFLREVSAVDTTGGSENIDVLFPVPRDVGASEPIFTVDHGASDVYTHVFKRAVLPRGFSVQHHFEDITQFFKYSGVKVSSMTLSIPQTGIATGNLDLRGKTATRAGTATGGALTKPSILPYVSHEGAMEEGGSGFALALSADITIDNEMDDTLYVIGSKERHSLPEGRGTCTGTVSVIFEDETLADKFRNETETSLKFTFTNSTSSTEIFLPKVKYTGGAGDPAMESAFGPVRLNNLPFQATVDTTTTNTDIQVTVISENWLY